MFKVSIISKYLILSILVFTFLRCNSNKGEKQKFYYIIKHPDLEQPSEVETLEINGETVFISQPKPPRLFPFFYGNYNFILIGSNQIFYHNKRGPIYFCGTGVDFSRPERLDLTPEDFSQIKLSNLERFLRDSISTDTLKDGREAIVKIASPKDTIFNPALDVIVKHIKKKGLKRWQIINSTEEENCVINSITEKKPYNLANCDFKFGFGGVKFNPSIQSDSIN
ncbi:hypothetical protein [Adhaeribacter soli]|uniref:Uncharacterized protein n=1 Tax=Adhaeribacter soli TaxID=2607655 RepID=A0A5N1IJY9_9BACT|nr:hypothetical protein [Adhaeribacter soli]KAA9326062.1 hypothetical protein F0P94_16750 [Adhaeribacter soli]